MASYAALGGKIDAEGGLKFLQHLFRQGYATGIAVSQRGAGANMSVDVSTGAAMITTSASVSYYGWTDAVTNVTVDASDPTNPRKDIVVAYIDLSLITSSTTNNSGALKFKAVAGTPAGSPADPSDGTIQSAVGAGNPFIKLARVAVAASASSIVNANLTDMRTPMALQMPYLYGGGSNTNGHLVPNVADDTVALLNAAQTLAGKTLSSPTMTGTVTVPDGSFAPAKLTNPYKFHAYATGSTTATAGGWTKVAFAGESFDSNNNFASNTYTAPVTGYYKFDAAVKITVGGAGETYVLALYKNNAEHKRGMYIDVSTAFDLNMLVSPPPIQLTAGDTVDIRIYNGSGGNKSTGSQSHESYFGGYLVSIT